MYRRNLILGASALILSLALLSGSAEACRVRVPVSGTQDLTITDPGEQWIDEDNIKHYRGMVQLAQLGGEDVDGVPVAGVGTYTFWIDVDMATGNGYMFARLSTDWTYGDREGSWRGITYGPMEGWVYDLTFIYYRGLGDFAGWRFSGTATGFLPVPTSEWEGHFIIPRGDADKAIAVESHTLSSVKELFR